MYCKVILCDVCGDRISDIAFRPKIIAIDDNNRLTDVEWTELNGVHLCKYCASEVVDSLAKQKRPEVKKPVKRKRRETNTERIDKGMIDALYRAGWSYKDIAGEMRLDVEVTQYCHNMYLKELRENGICI